MGEGGCQQLNIHFCRFPNRQYSTMRKSSPGRKETCQDLFPVDDLRAIRLTCDTTYVWSDEMWRLRGGWQCWSAHQGGRAPSALTWEPVTESYICSFSRIISGKKSFPILALKPLGGRCAPQVKWVFSEWCSECVKKWGCNLQIQLFMEACIHLLSAQCPYLLSHF